MKPRFFNFILAVICACVWGSPAFGADALIGENGALMQTTFPFGTNFLSSYQQIYAASAFNGPIRIDQITFYPTGAPEGVPWPANYEVELSTTSVAVGALSTTPSANLGADNAVFSNGTLSGDLSSSALTLSSSTPFYYNPANGNLLLTIYQTGASAAQPPLDFLLDASDSPDFSRMFDYTDPSNAATIVTNMGLVTKFSAPEPQTWLMLAPGLALFVLVFNRSAWFRSRDHGVDLGVLRPPATNCGSRPGR